MLMYMYMTCYMIEHVWGGYQYWDPPMGYTCRLCAPGCDVLRGRLTSTARLTQTDIQYSPTVKAANQNRLNTAGE